MKQITATAHWENVMNRGASNCRVGGGGGGEEEKGEGGGGGGGVRGWES